MLSAQTEPHAPWGTSNEKPTLSCGPLRNVQLRAFQTPLTASGVTFPATVQCGKASLATASNPPLVTKSP